MAAQDKFERLERRGLGAEAGLEYRRKILEPGAEREASALVRDYLGRSPNLKALLRTFSPKKRATPRAETPPRSRS